VTRALVVAGLAVGVLVIRGVQGVGDHVHGADERRHEGARDLRPRLTFGGGAKESIR
jgi:hypothetical protein